MPYIPTETVKEKRVQLRKMFPKLKLSVSTRHHSVIVVSVMEGNIPFPDELLDNGEKYHSVNHFYIEKNFEDYPEWKKVLTKIKSVIGKEQRELVYDGDYGSVPTYYINMSIGKWDREYVYKSSKK
jgi:hypothetical protein